MTAGPAESVDRAARVRRALLELVAEHGFRGTSMAAVAERAGVAAGTAYVHYSSKDNLVIATYQEVKADLSVAAVDGLNPEAPPAATFALLWYNVYEHLAADPDRARFLLQVEASPHAERAYAAVASEFDIQLMTTPAVAAIAEAVADLPLEVLYLLGLGPAVRLAARVDEHGLDARQLDEVAAACWRAVTVPG